MTAPGRINGGRSDHEAIENRAERPGQSPTRLVGGTIVDVTLDELEDSPFQVKQYADSRVKDLAETIRKQGLLQSATVRRVNER
jgi:ParB-like nuclease domain